MEYVMTYSWAILAIMVVGVVLWQFGFFDSEMYATSSNGFSKIKPMLTTIKVSSDGVFQGFFVNGLGKEANLWGVIIRDKDGNLLCCSSHNMPQTGFGGPSSPTCATAGLSHAASNVAGVDYNGFPTVYPVEDSGVKGPQINKGGEFIVEMGRTPSHVPPGTAVSRCTNTWKKGQLYSVRVEFFYTISLGGVSSSLSDSGMITGQTE